MIHLIAGKLSFETDKLVENIEALMDTIIKAKPASSKGNYIKNLTLTSSMGPGIKLVRHL
jgi:large subunit ribosomal protein L1